MRLGWKTLPKYLVLAYIFMSMLAAVLSMLIPEKIHALIVNNTNLNSENVFENVVSVLTVTFLFGFIFMSKNAIGSCIVVYGERLFSRVSISLSAKQSKKGTGIEQFSRIRDAYTATIHDSIDIVAGTMVQSTLAIYYLGKIISIKISILAIVTAVIVILYSAFTRKWQRANRNEWNTTVARETDYSYRLIKRNKVYDRDDKAFNSIGLSLLRNLRNNFLISLPVMLIIFSCLAIGYYISFQSGGVPSVILWQLYFGMLMGPLASISNDIEDIIHYVTDITVNTSN